jgi:hypothetical protein
MWDGRSIYQASERGDACKIVIENTEGKRFLGGQMQTGGCYQN